MACLGYTTVLRLSMGIPSRHDDYHRRKKCLIRVNAPCFPWLNYMFFKLLCTKQHIVLLMQNWITVSIHIAACFETEMGSMAKALFCKSEKQLNRGSNLGKGTVWYLNTVHLSACVRRVTSSWVREKVFTPLLTSQDWFRNCLKQPNAHLNQFNRNNGRTML